MALELGVTLNESGRAIEHAYFPVAGIVSQVTRLDDGAQLEVGIVGDEGMLGISLVLGMAESFEHLVVRSSGNAWRISAAKLASRLADDGDLQRTLQRYVYALMAQARQTAACSHFHTIEARLARWLLQTRDRLHSRSFFLTHEFLAAMLAVRRAGITRAATSLRDRGLIQYTRGQISVLDGAGLERVSCACYRQAKRSYLRAFAE